MLSLALGSVPFILYETFNLGPAQSEIVALALSRGIGCSHEHARCCLCSALQQSRVVRTGHLKITMDQGTSPVAARPACFAVFASTWLIDVDSAWYFALDVLRHCGSTLRDRRLYELRWQYWFVG